MRTDGAVSLIVAVAAIVALLVMGWMYWRMQTLAAEEEEEEERSRRKRRRRCQSPEGAAAAAASALSSPNTTTPPPPPAAAAPTGVGWVLANMKKWTTVQNMIRLRAEMSDLDELIERMSPTPPAPEEAAEEAPRSSSDPGPRTERP